MIMPDIVEVPESFELFKNRDLPKQPTEKALEVIKILDKLIKPLKLLYYRKPSRTHHIQRLKIRQKRIINKTPEDNLIETKEETSKLI